MNYVIAVFDTLATVGVFYAGYKFGGRGKAAIEFELKRIEDEYTYFANVWESASPALHNEVRKITARIRRLL